MFFCQNILKFKDMLCKSWNTRKTHFIVLCQSGVCGSLVSWITWSTVGQTIIHDIPVSQRCNDIHKHIEENKAAFKLKLFEILNVSVAIGKVITVIFRYVTDWVTYTHIQQQYKKHRAVSDQINAIHNAFIFFSHILMLQAFLSLLLPRRRLL